MAMHRCFVIVACLSMAFLEYVFAQGVSAQQLVKVTLRTDYKVNGYVGVFALARERGFYREQGLDVEIGEGQGSSTTVQTVAVGEDTFGLADATALVIGISARDIPVKAVSVYSQTDIQGFAYHPESGWDGKIEKMRGKVLISSAGAAELTIIPAILASAGLTMNDINLQLADPAARIPLFIRSPDSFMGAYATGDVLRVRLRMPNVGYVPFSKYGIVTFGTSLITKTKTIEENPALVRKFVAASDKGWDLAVQDPEAAVQAARKLFPASDPTFLRDGLKILIAEQLHTPASRGKPIGWMAESDWVAMIEILKKYSNVKPKEVSAYFTNDFIPKP
jgi:NitT/TauT family transport system substrate-binding protein